MEESIMSKLLDWIIAIDKDGKVAHGQVFDFICKSGAALITDYSYLNEDVEIQNSVEVFLGEKKKRKTLTSISDLRDILNEIVSATLEILFQHTPYDSSNPYTYPDFSDLETDLLVDQLVFDVLFDKYLQESEQMTRNGYSTYMAEKLCTDNGAKKDSSHAIYEQLTRGMSTFHDMNKYSGLREQWKMLGIDPDIYAKYYAPNMKENSCNKKPCYIWNQLYYNFCLPLTARQYRRQFTRDNRNYSYEETFNDLKSYHDFVTKLLPREFESYQKYFLMSMDYYALESYKRVDFIFKLIDTLDPSEIVAIINI